MHSYSRRTYYIYLTHRNSYKIKKSKYFSNILATIITNVYDGLLDARTEMTTFLHLIASEPEIARVPVMAPTAFA